MTIDPVEVVRDHPLPGLPTLFSYWRGLVARECRTAAEREGHRAIVTVAAIALLTGAARAQESPGGTPATARVPVSEGRASSAPLQAIARWDGVPAVGLRVRLIGSDSIGPHLRYRWIQTSGPPVALDTPAEATARFTVPEGGANLGFLLIVGGEAGIGSASLTIPVQGPTTSAGAGLRADAGDDQLGVVGRQVTLNGIRSEPQGALAFRWVQVAGPTIRFKIEDRYVYTFVPGEPGLYRFALVVAGEGGISEPDTVDVIVGLPRGAAGPVAVSPPAQAASSPQPTVPPRELARTALASVEDGAASATRLAAVFQEIAGRMGLYESYAVLLQELTRRLEEVVPPDAARRAQWNERVFVPLTSRIVERMRQENLDLTSPTGLTTPFNDRQRSELEAMFQAIAEGFQAVRTDPR